MTTTPTMTTDSVFIYQSDDEQCFVLFGRALGIKPRRFDPWYGVCDSYSKGSPGAVKFDWEYVWEHRDEVVGFVHTHPNMAASPSARDYATMHASVFALGKPLVCCIEGYDGLRAHWFLDDESPHVEGRVCRVGQLIVGQVPRLKGCKK